MQKKVNCPYIVHDINPISHIKPITVERHFLIFNNIGNKERYDFFRILVGTEIIDTARDHHWHLIGAYVGIT